MLILALKLVSFSFKFINYAGEPGERILLVMVYGILWELMTKWELLWVGVIFHYLN
jgi:hypothetical protein